MQYTKLGRTGLRVSKLCLGTVNFGPYTPEDEAHAILSRALESGINFIDTADVYGHQPGEGLTERIVGRWMHSSQQRHQIVLATKVYNAMNREGASDPNQEQLLNARKIIANCEASLKRLQTDYIDLYQMHHVDRNCPWDEIWQAMETLVQQGKVLYIGSSNFAGWDIATANQLAGQRHFLGLVSEQSLYNLAQRMIELEVIPACRHYGLGLLPWSPLASGLLAGLKPGETGVRRGKGDSDRWKQHAHALQQHLEFCSKIGQLPSRVSIAWLLHNPVVTAPIIGPRTVEQLNELLDTPELALSAEWLQELDEIWPGPGGEAPKAYAW